MGSDVKIARALISVTDKTGVVDFARTLVDDFGVEIISTGGTARAIEDAGVPVTPIEEFTGYPEMMDGRVKTLHPKVHGALLACERAEDFCEREGVEKGGFACASDAFFPFRDNVDVLAAHGVTCIIQPGGSKRDDESIQACNEHGIAMVFTGARHFRH